MVSLTSRDKAQREAGTARREAVSIQLVSLTSRDGITQCCRASRPQVSIQLVSLTSRDKLGAQILSDVGYVSIQLVSLTSRDSRLGSIARASSKFPFNWFP